MVTERLDSTRLNRYVWTDKYGTSDNNFVAEKGNNKGQVSDSERKKQYRIKKVLNVTKSRC